MNAKRILILLLIAGVAAAGAFASGKEEQQPLPPPGSGPELSEDTVTITGQLFFENRIHPELKSGDREYELLVPRFYGSELELEEGQTVTVEGYTVQEMPCCEEEEGEEVHLWVTKAIIDGKEYELDDGRRMGPGSGSRWGMHGRRGMMGPGHWGDDGRWDRRDDGWGRRR
jgi:hypothetical protein